MDYLSQHRWVHDGRQYEINNFPDPEFDAWCYEVYEVPGTGRNDYVELRIPDLTPLGPFTPGPAKDADLLAHGEPVIPLPILLRLLDLARQYGHLVDPPPDDATDALGRRLPLSPHRTASKEPRSARQAARAADCWCRGEIATSSSAVRTSIVQSTRTEPSSVGGVV